MNQIFHEYLDKFVVVYLDDIVVYSRSLDEHASHLRTVLESIKQNKLYVYVKQDKIKRISSFEKRICS